MRARILTFVLMLPSAAPAAAGAAQPPARVALPAGTHVPFYGEATRVPVAAFTLDRHPVSQSQFAAFVHAHPQWRRDRVSRTFADARYLADWVDALHPGADAAHSPVVNVSWFAARAYCAAAGGRLPTVNEWEYAASASETARNATSMPAFRARLLELTTRAGSPRIGSGFRNYYGVHDLHGVVREWTLDFNNIMVSDDSRGTDEAQLYCAAGAIRARDPADYAAFLRFALRASVSGRSTVSNLGFRCAGSIS